MRIRSDCVIINFQFQAVITVFEQTYRLCSNTQDMQRDSSLIIICSERLQATELGLNPDRQTVHPSRDYLITKLIPGNPTIRSNQI
jgi:hypothetical protein